MLFRSANCVVCAGSICATSCQARLPSAGALPNLPPALRADGKVYRFTADGHMELVVSGLINPWGLRFVGNRLLVSDINGDFIYGKRELPDGFIVEVRAQ